LGLGVLARDVISALQSRGVAVAALDIDPGIGRVRHDLSHANLCVERWSDLPSGVAIWILSPEYLGRTALRFPNLYLRRDALNVALSMWEVPMLPKHLTPCVNLFDVMVAESHFFRHIIDTQASSVRTVPAKHFLNLPPDIRADRKLFGIPEDSVVFGCAFDPNSDILRKNPQAVVNAFIDAVGNEPNAYLAVKLNSRNLPTVLARDQLRLLDRVASHPRIRLIKEVMDYKQTLAFYASCDVYVSLHRAEGLGLSLMEAMALGKPVIATAWSGNMSFMSDRDSCLVGCRLIPVQGTVAQYRKNLDRHVAWAEPDVKEAAAWMRRLWRDAELRSRIGGQAAQAASSYRAEAARCEYLDDIAHMRHNWAMSAVDQTLFADRRRRLDACYRGLYSKVHRALDHAGDIYGRHVGWRFRHASSDDGQRRPR
jgi:glycosyltransferase involved in cell wall biosynthesis